MPIRLLTRPLPAAVALGAVAALAAAGPGVARSPAPAMTPAPPTTGPAATTPGWAIKTFPAEGAPGGSAGLLAFPDRHQVAWWSSGDRKLGTPSAGTSFLGITPGGGEARRTSIDDVPVGPPVLAGSSARLLTSEPNRFAELRELRLRTMSATGRLGTPVELSGRSAVVGAGLAASAQGDLVVAWLEARRNADRNSNNTARLLLKVRTMRPGGTLTATRTLASLVSIGQPDGNLAVAVSGEGNFVVAYGDTGAYATNAQLRRGGAWDVRRTAQVRAWTGTTRSSPASRNHAYAVAGFRSSLQAAAGFSGDGHAVLAWGSQTHGEEVESPWVVRAATLGRSAMVRPAARSGAPAAGFSKPQVLDPGAGKWFPISGLHLAETGGGQPVLFWGNVQGDIDAQDAYPLYAATASDSGRFAPRLRLAANAGLGGVAVSPTGALAVTAGQPAAATTDAPGDALLATRVPPGTQFGPAAPLAIPGFAQPAVGSSLPAFDRDGDLSVAWVDGGSATVAPRLVVATRPTP